MKSLFCVAMFAGVAATVLAQTDASSLSGTWVLQKDNTVKLVLEQTSDSVHVKETKGDRVVADYTCKTDGKDCKVKEEGHSEKVSLWFNGPKLVELITRGSDVTRRRFTVADGGKTLQVELAPMSTPEKTEVLAYSR
ncbi:MAG: hypothetical protein KGN84_04640 [Acidobacteriota bacterium]|nr:hypothetical protein [Acidobacteriota bacterium]